MTAVSPLGEKKNTGRSKLPPSTPPHVFANNTKNSKETKKSNAGREHQHARVTGPGSEQREQRDGRGHFDRSLRTSEHEVVNHEFMGLEIYATIMER